MGNLNRTSVEQIVQERNSREWEKLEKILLTIVGGTLAASATLFVNNDMHFIHKTMLAVAWISLSLSLIFLLSSYAFSEYFTSTLLLRVRAQPEELSVEVFESLKSRTALWGIRITNYGALLLGVAGIVFLAFFAFSNIS